MCNTTALGKGGLISIPDIYIKLPYDTTNRRGQPMRRWRYVPIAAVASTYRKEPVNVDGIIQEEDESATYQDAYLLISNRHDVPEEVAAVYVKRWRIEVFYRTIKQELGLTNCHSWSEEAHFAHMELLFTVGTLLCYARWECNKEGAEEALSHREMVRYLFNASHRICCYEQQIQVYFDTTGDRFSRFIEKFWPPHPFLWLWNWCHLPITA
ncbi:transposase [Pelotomaculum propionicicum]